MDPLLILITYSIFVDSSGVPANDTSIKMDAISTTIVITIIAEMIDFLFLKIFFILSPAS